MNYQSDKLKNASVLASISLAVFLILLKTVAFLKTDSLAIFSSLVDSVTDLFASAISGIAVYFSTKPATNNHRYGFGKTEALSALFQALFVGVSGLFVLVDGINRLVNPVEIKDTELGLYIMITSVILTALLVLFQSYVAKKTNSLAIKADMAHYVVDFLTNGTVIISLVLVKVFGFVYFDIIAAIFISIYLIYNAYDLAKESVDMITDKELGEDVRCNIENIIKKCNDVHGVHDLRTRSLGDIYFIEMHIEIDGNFTLNKAHEITENVEKKIKELYANSQILIHQDPLGIDEERLDNVLNKTKN